MQRKRLTRTRAFRALCVATLGIAALAGCTSAAAPAAMCGFIVGNGEDGNDQRIKQVVYPNQNVSYDNAKYKAQYVPCNPRTFIINPEGQKNANGEDIGDRHYAVEGRTSDGTPIKIWLTAYWTLNQSEEALTLFYPLCHKFDCYSSESESGTANFADPGWNGMLGEVLSPAIDDAARVKTPIVNDAIWRIDDPTQYDILGNEMSAEFMTQVAATTGYNLDLFCGSGNSGWPNPEKPGEGEFTCTQVRIDIDDVEPMNPEQREAAEEQNLSEQNLQQNQQRLNEATALYGNGAGYWLGLQDTIKACREQGQTCSVILGGGNSAPVVTVPQQAQPAG